MKCKIIIVSDDNTKFANIINDFIKDKDDCHVSASNSRFFCWLYSSY